MAATEPFKLLSYEGVLQHRREIFRPELFQNCFHRKRPGSFMLRGMAPRYSAFLHQFWHYPEVLGIISQHAGMDLVPAMDYEICHTDVQVGPHGLAGFRATPFEPYLQSPVNVECVTSGIFVSRHPHRRLPATSVLERHAKIRRPRSGTECGDDYAAIYSCDTILVPYNCGRSSWKQDGKARRKTDPPT